MLMLDRANGLPYGEFDELLNFAMNYDENIAAVQEET